MSGWTADELDRIGAKDLIEIAGRRRDGTLRDPVIIWVVRHGDDLYVRSVNGPAAAWFRGARARHEGRIWAGGVEKDVTFEDAGGDIDDELDAAYRTKYSRSPEKTLDAMTSPEARSTTLRLVPSEESP
jgi:hypothetical protein